MPHAPVSPQQRNRAKSLRKEMTCAETLLWRHLKAGHLDGLKFRRQTPMANYILDFVSHGAKLVIEVDGATHDFEEQLKRDAVRDAWLATQGYKVLRFTNNQVLSELEGVLIVIRDIANARARGGDPSP